MILDRLLGRSHWDRLEQDLQARQQVAQQNAQEALREVPQTFSPRRWIRRYPYGAIGASATVGFFAVQPRAPQRPRRSSGVGRTLSRWLGSAVMFAASRGASALNPAPASTDDATVPTEESPSPVHS